MSSFDLLSSDHFHVILHPDKKHGLIFNRLDGATTTINYDDAKELANLKRIGCIHGIIGLYLNRYLVLIKSRDLVGLLYDPHSKKEHEIYVITQVQVIDVSSQEISSRVSNSVRYDVANNKNEPDIDDSNTLKDLTQTGQAEIREDYSSLPITISTSSYASMQSRAAPWNPFKLANSLRPKMPAQLLKSTGVESLIGDAGNSSSSSISNQAGARTDESDKRLVEEMVKLFNNTNSFYFSPTLDLTKRFSRKISSEQTQSSASTWKTADERFFWNKHMLKDLIELSEGNNEVNHFILVILQGFIAIENHISVPPCSIFNESGIENGLLATSVNLSTTTSCSANIQNSNQLSSCGSSNQKVISGNKDSVKRFKLALVSRRSVFHAGTRYRRRGCDEDGNCANFVETEQVFMYDQHFTSVVMLRGSIPLFWYQSGYNYRPPPVLFRSEKENRDAFEKHFNNLADTYDADQIISVDCTEQSGREKSLHDEYQRYMGMLQSTERGNRFKLIQFDFHKQCRGRQCSDIQVERHLKSCGLTEKLIKDQRYFWNDGEVVWLQKGVFRVNCLDCSDRTNVVQRAIALQILNLQLSRLGVIAPDTCPEDNEFRRMMQIMWSTNGNVLSTQYCGTRALFTGDRKLSGYLKDTYSSASRYYISKFRDAYRQAAIDAMLGVETIEKDMRPGEHRDKESGVDQYELIGLDPLFTARSGGELLKDVSSRVTNRLARLKGKFYVKPPGSDNIGLSHRATEAIDEEDHSEVSPEKADEAVTGLNIDWPSSESVDNSTDRHPISIFDQISNSDESFQDDEFGQLMLSIDLTELQKLRDDESKALGADGSDKKQVPEEIDMRETRGLRVSNSESEVTTTSTTST